MSLTFGASSSDDATKSSPSGLGLSSLTSVTTCGWLRCTTLTNTRMFFRIGGSSGAQIQMRLSGSTGNIQLAQTGAVNMVYITNDTPLATTGTWVFVAGCGTIGTGGHIYTGTLTTPLSERSYSQADVGTGPPTAETGTNELVLGNGSSSNTIAFQGQIGRWQVYDRELTLGELQTIQFTGRMLSGCKANFYLGDTGTSTVRDYSGNGNSLTISGATVSANPPLGLYPGLRSPGGVFGGIANSAPTATISFPPNNNWKDYAGAPTVFEGSGSDTEDGALTGASLVWNSSIDGDFDTGTTADISGLSTGTHTITLTATDSGALTGTATRTVVIGPALGTAAQFITRRFQMPDTQGGSWGVAPGDWYYQVFLPKDTALATQGWTGQPYRMMVAHHGSGENGNDNEAQMTGGSSLPQKLGYSGTPSTTWPILTAFPQKPTSWAGDSTTAVNASRGITQMTALLIDDLDAEFNVDRDRVAVTGLSLGGYWVFTAALMYPDLFCCIIPCASAIRYSTMSNMPGYSGISPATDAGASTAVVAVIRDIPSQQFNSTNDGAMPPAWYNPSVTAYNAAGPPSTWHFTESVTFTHEQVWSSAYDDLTNASGSSLRTWYFAQGLNQAASAGAVKRYRKHLLLLED